MNIILRKEKPTDIENARKHTWEYFKIHFEAALRKLQKNPRE